MGSVSDETREGAVHRDAVAPDKRTDDPTLIAEGSLGADRHSHMPRNAHANGFLNVRLSSRIEPWCISSEYSVWHPSIEAAATLRAS